VEEEEVGSLLIIHQPALVAMVAEVMALFLAMLRQQQEHQILVVVVVAVDGALRLFKLPVVVMAVLV
jgi:hypothetical protein